MTNAPTPQDFASPISAVIDELWERRTELGPADSDARKAVTEAVDLIDAGTARAAFVDRATDEVVVDERAKRAILLSFKVLDMVESNAGDFRYHDKMPLKTDLNGARVVPGAIVRWGSYLAPGSIVMPGFINIGGYLDSGSMLDTWATIGSCAQIGKNVHLSGGVGIGGVLEPANAVPVVIEDDAFIGSRSMVVEGARVRQGAKLGSGTNLTKSMRVFDAETGEELPRGEAPAWSVCVTSTRVKKFPGGEFTTPCLLVLRRLAPGEAHDKLQINDMLRDSGFTG
ncbi:2,3,4,5-tetrahydropyridine-2,6-dicarboxylate N-succinyltransferase [Catenulispora pinisilvae]|uniref:2,3,4,5-tetrahydropyridine-2,6-dicarboxylate N-succinyltransferase n=1 Tax=Catenulispora pinisilvae TaxID=2705253 RepID=UPI0018916EEB|nr:2,3,4,5-tetrahydropyridine-2,6-dicarboxylate N-succinyltransferase [Catenulispora pinisilvae]